MAMLSGSVNKTLIQALERHAAEHPDDWPQFIDYVLYAYRTTVHSVTGFTPFELLFGRPHNSMSNHASCSPADSSVPASLLQRAHEIKDLTEGKVPLALQNVLSAQLSQRRAQDAAHAIQLISAPLTVGSVVYTRILTRQKKLEGPHFIGPYKVAQVNEGGNYVLMNAKGNKPSRSYPITQLKIMPSAAADRIWQEAVSKKGAFSVDRILDYRIRPDGKRLYLIRWRDHDPEFDQWIEESLVEDQDLIGQFWGEHPSLPPTTADIAASAAAQPREA